MFWKDSQRLLVMAQVFLCLELLFGPLSVVGGESQIDTGPLFLSHCILWWFPGCTWLLGGIYRAIHGGDMCAVKKSGGSLSVHGQGLSIWRTVLDRLTGSQLYYRPLLLMY